MPTSPSPRHLSRARQLARRLVAWYGESRRELPWRERSEAYAIWISEVMLQQTRVEVVAGRYGDFLRRFPDLGSLARAELSEVLAAWAGLGYYRRARQLHAAAQRIHRDHGSELPADAAQLQLLPGFGPYTAGAVASIAFDQPVPAIDGNVERVLSRLFAIDDPPKGAAARQQFDQIVRAMLRHERPSELNQALMELGALLCVPRNPRCDECPWEPDCAGARSGVPESYPRKPPARATVEVSCYSAVLRDGPRYLFRRRPTGGHNAGLWELPTTHWHGGAPQAQGARTQLEQLARELGMRWRVGDALCRVRHTITHHRIQVVAHEVQLEGRAAVGCRWWTQREAVDAGLAASTRKLLESMPSLL